MTSTKGQMKSKWAIVSDSTNRGNLPVLKSVAGFHVYSTENFFRTNEKIEIGIDGFITPRNELFNEYQSFNQFDLVNKLYLEYGTEFSKYIKGVFSIIILDHFNEEIHIKNDHLGINKFFSGENKGTFYCSNSYSTALQYSSKKIDPIGIACYLISNHFIGGISTIIGLRHSTPATHLLLKNKKVLETKYFEISDWINKHNPKASESDLQNSLENSINNQIKYHNPKSTHLTLTGGIDNRLTLSFLLKKGIKPKAFTYGHPNSKDIVFAARISKSLELDYSSFYPEVSSKWMNEMVDEMQKVDDYTLNIHRAHRFNTFKEYGNKEAILLGGYCGGEILRSYFADGIHINPFTNEWIHLTKNEERRELLSDSLKEKQIRLDKNEEDKLFSFLQEQSFSSTDILLNKFFLTFQLSVPLQHAQDINIGMQFYKMSLPVFLDIDFLELCFRSKYNFMSIEKRNRNIKPLISLRAPYFSCKTILGNNKEIAQIPFAKQGLYTPEEVVKNGWIGLLLKRVFRKYFKKETRNYANNFTLGEWMDEFIHDKLNEKKKTQTAYFDKYSSQQMLEEYSKIAGTYNTEVYWRPVSNHISILMLLEQLEKYGTIYNQES